MIKRFNQFLNEEIKLKYDTSFREFLNSDDSEIADFLISLENNEVDVAFTNLKMDDDLDMLSFNPADKNPPKNIYAITSQDISKSVNMHYMDSGFKEFIIEKIINPGYYLYPTKIPNDWKIPNQLELVYIIQARGEYLHRQFSEIDISDINNLNIENDTNYIILKDTNQVYYIFNHSIFSSYLRHIDYKPNRLEKGGIGRLVNKIIQARGGNFNPKELEDFINRYKSYRKWLSGDVKLEVVSGEEIRKWYNEENYSYGKGSLNKSCMRGEDSQEFFDIYVENPEVCQMLILFNHNGTKINGRALLWKTVYGLKVMDRVYTTQDHFVDIFNKWADNNSYITKSNLLSNSSVNKIQLKPGDYYPYPYLDTFIYYNKNKSQLSTSTKAGDIILNSVDGEYIVCEICGGDGIASCYDCGGDGYNDVDGERTLCDECGGRGTLDCPECS